MCKININTLERCCIIAFKTYIINHHNLRQNNYDKTIFKIAANHVIDNELRKSKITEIKPPNNIKIIDDIKYENYTVEEVYKYLLKKIESETKELYLKKKKLKN